MEFIKIYKMVIICQLVFLKASTVLPQIQSRIVGGTPTTIRNVPYLVQLLDNGKFFCGGSLIAPRFVITAAHCVNGITAQTLSIVAGATKLTQAGVRSNVSKIMVPKEFSTATMNMDVAVLKLSSPLKGNNIRSIGLCGKSWQPGATFKVSGWGLTNENARNVPNQVHTVNVKAIAKPKCAKLLRRQARLTKSMFCAGEPGRKDACLGDSGGPAIRNGRLCGIVSWGIGCAGLAPGIYTSLAFSNVHSFINKAKEM